MCHAIVLFSKKNKVSYNLLHRVPEVAKNKTKKCINKTQKIEILDHEISRIILKQDSKD